MLAIGVELDIDSRDIAPVLTSIVGRTAGLDLTLHYGTAETVEQGLMAGEYDAAVLALDENATGRLQAHLIRDDPFVLGAEETHPLAGRAATTLASLDHQPMVVRSSSWYEAALTTLMEARGFERVVRHRSNDARWIADLVRNGRVCAILPKTTAELNRFTAVALPDVDLRYRTSLVTVAGRRHSPALAALIASVAGRC